ncbi:cobalt-precorrin 5A hydrolase [Clostridium sp. BL-8]|uniref:cobalt-precorrin 5A hydrolase n=1 Tax=Clostridium sp. BL-8 TaxID=349938 RepID=UPI00098C4741|nr:cobalt-precorrin 5A hydrolase [Clostridium sp. BL-8]OOM80450.1 cobalamin biosynthesis protein CbiG [Clostridium sp. BL-8]
MNEEKAFNISIICPSPSGKKIALKLQENLTARLYIKEKNNDLLRHSSNFESEIKNESDDNRKNTYIYGEDFKLSNVTKEAMSNSKGIIFISSTGIAVRAIAPFLKGKAEDPGVVVVDLSGKHAINILSGHIGGGNELTLKVSKILNSMPIITTASDNIGLTAPDIIAKENNLIIEDLKKAKYISSLLIDKKVIGVKDDYNYVKFNEGYEKVEKLREDCIWITHNLQDIPAKEVNYSKVLRLIKRDLVLGIGCKKGTPYNELNKFICSSLIDFNLDVKAVAAIASIDIKANEEGIVKLAQKLNCPFKTFNREEIKTVEDNYDKSEFVFKTLGVTGVCEPCVELAGAKVIISKIKHNGMTLAIGVLEGSVIT